MKKWTTNSWRKYPVKHIPKYEDDKELNLVLNKLKVFSAFSICRRNNTPEETAC